MDQRIFFTADALKATFDGHVTKSRAVGLDGVRLNHFSKSIDAEVSIIEQKVFSSLYGFTGYREKLISRGASKLPRQLSIPTVRDRLTLRSICNCLSVLAPHAHAMPPHAHVKAIAKHVRGSDEPLSFLRMDVRDFFPTINHELLTNALVKAGAEPFLVTLILSAIRNPTAIRRSGKINTIGVPQGLSISNILSAIYLSEFDAEQRKQGIYHRYVDDILVVAPSQEINKRYISLFTQLNALLLKPHPLGVPGKTEEKRISEGVDYLGYRISKDDIGIRASSYKKMFGNLLKVLTSFRFSKSMEKTLFKLNLRITGCFIDGRRRGWLMFFSQTENLGQLARLDKFVVQQMTRLKLRSVLGGQATFLRSYHEIRYFGEASRYIPNFDTYTRSEKAQTIALLTDKTLAEVEARNAEFIDEQFDKLIAREVSDLEADVLAALS
ncbi:reverse transcriptase domain-containing protein [Sphingomonas albertensis]|uniref:Reverse transcriptase domain-containing protein n=1 Tax=Sphingomonas albertensis TaxID=2762591 RepID=A0ABR7AKF0_9SPHN|nr:reverse transcriptase domain-containing protein [Sphingomonas albertensis]MBC3940930.1 hypothetical protein [Sphingomonas albertensis]